MRLFKLKAHLFFVLLCLAAPLASASFNEAMKIYQSGDLKRAQEAFHILAGIGDRQAIFNLGVMHYRGEHVEQDPIRGYALMFLAAKGHADDGMTGTVQRVHESFSQAQRAAAGNMIEALSPTYDAAVIREQISPVLLDDEDCAPEIEAQEKTRPDYPRREWQSGNLGFTLMEITISPQGYPRDIYVDRSVSADFTQASVSAMRKSRYLSPPAGAPIYGHRTAYTYVFSDGRGDVKEIKTGKLRKQIAAGLSAAEAGDAVAQLKYARSLEELKLFDDGLKPMKLQYRDANRWLAESARGGLPHAQFELGRNMMDGRGCQEDAVNGMRWIEAAAVGGQPQAQFLLARRAEQQAQVDQENLAMMSWLRSAALSGYYPAKLKLAWELSTSGSPALHNGSEALLLLEEESDRYFDAVRVLETRAAAHARKGEYKKAVKLQQQAVSEAESLDWSIPTMYERLGVYEQGSPWVGGYFQ